MLESNLASFSAETERLKSLMLSAMPHEYWAAREAYLRAVGNESSERARIDPLRFSRGERSELDALLQL